MLDLLVYLCRGYSFVNFADTNMVQLPMDYPTKSRSLRFQSVISRKGAELTDHCWFKFVVKTIP